jgi:hypothetical protein
MRRYGSALATERALAAYDELGGVSVTEVVIELRRATCAHEGRESNLLAEVVTVDGALYRRTRGSLRSSPSGRAQGLQSAPVPAVAAG